VPVYTQFNHYNNNTMPQHLSSVDSSDSQHNVEGPQFKRLRNTAASAHFRAKKKQREKMMEQNV
jgi:hypothetical protein